MIKPEVVRKAIAIMHKGRANYDYFFNNLKSPDWIDPLTQAGFFKTPPAVDYGDGHFTVLRWPESEYLARVAGMAPGKVVTALKAVPKTDNPRVHEDIADAAMAMPPVDAAKLVPLLVKCLGYPHQLLLPRKASDLIAHLLSGGEASAALALFRSLLRFRPSNQENENIFQRDAAAYVDDYTYEGIVQKHSLPLATQIGDKTLEALLVALQDYTQKSRKQNAGSGPEDWSCFSRPAIEDHIQNRNWAAGVFSALITAARDVATVLSTDDAEHRAQVLMALRNRPWSIFHRIALHLLASLPGVRIEEVVPWLLNREFFDGYSCRHEYKLVAKRFFGYLSPTEQETLLSWIDEYDLEYIARRHADAFGVPLDLDEAQRIADNERLKWLSPLRSELPDVWQTRTDELLAIYGEPEHPEFPVYSSGTAWGPTSPKTIEELKELSVADIVLYANQWQPPQQDRGLDMPPSVEGLGRAITQLVTNNPGTFAREASLFIGSSRSYVRAVLAGLRQAASQEVTFPWDGVVALSQWAISQPYTGPVANASFDEPDPDWSSARQGIADLFGVGMQSNVIPFEARQEIWAILSELANDPDPVETLELPDGNTQFDPLSLSFNSVRGEAIDGVIQYALWVRRNLDTDSSNMPERNDAPEVTTLLDDHLNTSVDPSLAIRSIFGRWFPWLTLIGRQWTLANIDRIFPSETSERKYWEAAWIGYITYSPPFDQTFKILKPQYLRALEHSVDLKANSTERLLEHIIIFYMRGLIEINDALVNTLFNSAPLKLRQYAIRFAGITIEQTVEIPEVVIHRIKALWEMRMVDYKATRSADNTEEAASFGWIFSSGRFEPDWALSILEQVLVLSNKIGDGDGVVKHLAINAADYPLQSVRCLRLIVESDKEEWSLSFWQEEIEATLVGILSSDNAEAQAIAVELIHRLGAMGQSGYRSLIPRSQ